jgi:hypothetical protein
VALPRGVRAARDRVREAQRRVQEMSGRVEAIMGGSATGVDRELAGAIAQAGSELERALQALHTLERAER